MFTLAAVSALALGIGVNSTIFTLTNAALFRSTPGIQDPEDLVWVSAVQRGQGRPLGLSYPEFSDYRAADAGSFDGVFAFHRTPVSFGAGGEPERLMGHFVSGDYFPALGVGAAVGRVMTSDAAGDAVVISHRLWRQRFDTSPGVVGTVVVLNGRRIPIIGVAPEGFVGPSIGETADVWLPLASVPGFRPSEPNRLAERGSSWLQVMGRVRRGVSRETAQAQLAATAARLEREYPETHRDRTVMVSSAGSGVSPGARGELVPLAALLLVITGLVLVIACANVANLLIARGASRSNEISIRAAVGASRRRLVRQLLTESLVLAAVGGAAGLLVSFWASDLLIAWLPETDFRGMHAGPDASVLLFTSVAVAISVCVFGLAPALTGTRNTLLPGLRRTPHAGRRSRWQAAFVVAQLSLSLVLLTAAGLSLRALQKASVVDLGFNADGLWMASYDLALQGYTPERRATFRRELRGRVEGIPGVVSTGVANMAPLSGTMVSTVVTAAGPGEAAAEAQAYLNGVGAGYFSTVEIPILAGRAFVERDTLGAPRTAIVNQTLARRLWGQGNPIGRLLAIDTEMLQVVGVARDAKYDEAKETARPFLYLPIDQSPQLDRETLLVRSSSVSESMVRLALGEFRALDGSLPVFDVQPMGELLRNRADRQRAISSLLAAFGALALLLAALGLYGVMAYRVILRTPEIGIRIALGASPSDVTSLMAREGFRLAGLGLLLGGLLAVPMALAVGTLVFGVDITEVAAFALTCGVMLAVALVASVLPARRAARLDPVVALRMND
jgi:predicted permease